MPYSMKESSDYFICDFRGGDYFESNKEHMKSELEGVRWDKNKKQWTAEKTPRNINIFKRLNGINIYEPYECPRVDITPILNYANRFMNIDKLKSYQVDMISHMYTRKRCINGAEMRMGKSLPTLLTTSYILNEYDENAILVTTKNAKYGLFNEIYKWKIPNLKKLSIMNYDYFTDHYTPDDTEIPLIVIFDEAQKLKNDSSRTYKAISIVQQQMSVFEESFTFLLSGTPAPNHQDDWYYLCEICLPGFLAENNKVRLRQNMTIWTTKQSPTGGVFMEVIAWKPEEIKRLGEERLTGLVEVYSKAKYLPDMMPPKKEVWTIPRCPQVDTILKTLPKLYGGGSKLRYAIKRLGDGIYDNKFFQTEKDKQLSKLIEEHNDVGRLVIYAFFKVSLTKLAKILIYHGWNVLKIDGSGLKSINSKYSSDKLLNEMDESQKELHDEKICAVIQFDIAEGLKLSASPTIIYYSNGENPNSRQQNEARINTLNSKFANQRIIDFMYMDIDLDTYTRLTNKSTLSKVVLNTIEMTEEERKKYYSNFKDVEIFKYTEDQSFDYLNGYEGEEFDSSLDESESYDEYWDDE